MECPAAETLCRLCLSALSTDEVVDLRSNDSQSADMWNKMNSVLSILFRDAINWPHRVCCKCVSSIQNISEFRELVANNQEVIVERFGTAVLIVHFEAVTEAVQEDIPLHVGSLQPLEPLGIEEAVVDSLMINEVDVEEVEEEEEDPVAIDQPSKRSSRRRTAAESSLETSAKKKNKPRLSVKDMEEVIQGFKPLKCDFCEEISESFNDLLNHCQELHDSEGYIICCEKKFRHRWRYHEHIMGHMNPEAFNCDQCPKTFPTHRALAGHKETHIPDDQKTHHCPLCSAKFYRQRKLVHHMTYTHPTDDQKVFKCDNCEKRFVSDSLLKHHFKTVHQNIRPFICEICARTFKTKHIFNEHIRTHSAANRVKCDECGKYYMNENQLKRHKRLHADAGSSFECSECGVRMKNSQCLRNHTTLVHRTDPNTHLCQICGKGFKTRTRLREHTAGHTGDRLYKCAFCEKDFNFAANKYKHQKIKHPAEFEEMRKVREMKKYSDQ